MIGGGGTACERHTSGRCGRRSGVRIAHRRRALRLRYESIKTKPKHTLNNFTGARWEDDRGPIIQKLETRN